MSEFAAQLRQPSSNASLDGERLRAADLIDRLQRELNRAHRIAGKADRMFDAIREFPSDDSVLYWQLVATANNYDLAMSDPQAEAHDGEQPCT